MSHRAEQIIDAIASNIASYSGYRGLVFKHRALTLSEQDSELPATSVDFGEDQPLDDDGATNMAYFDSLLTVETTIYARAADESELKSTLLDMRRTIHQALMAANDQGLGFVIETRYGGADRPEVNAESELLVGRLLCRWPVYYRMNISDPGDG